MNRLISYFSRTAIASLVLLTSFGCAGGEDASEASESAVESADTMEDGLLFTISGLSGPEAVRYDPAQDVYFVSNFNGSGGDRDANGFISRVSAADGSVESLHFIEGTDEAPLHAPRGMWIEGDVLWVADVDGVHGFNRVSGEAEAFVDMSSFEPGFLNDVTAGPDGTLYVSDTGRSRLYQIVDGNATVAVEGDEVAPPNGITWDAENGRILIAPWAGGGGTVRAWEPGTETVSVIAPTVGDRVDGIEVFGGAIIVAVQSDSSIYSIRDQVVTRSIELEGPPADIAIDTQRSRVAIPYIALDRVEVWAVQ